MLNIVNKSPLDRNALDACLRIGAPGALLLIEDGVYAAARNTAVASRIEEAMKSIAVYALKPDIDARGMQDRVLDGVRLVDYGGFVDLVAEHDAVQSWL